MLEMLSSLDLVSFTHRPAISREQLLGELDQWADDQTLPGRSLLYLAGHGDSGSYCTATEHVPFAEIAEHLAGRLPRRVVHLGVCDSALRSPDGDAPLGTIRRLTGASLVSGYGGETPWYESAGFETIYFGVLSDYAGQPSRAIKYIDEHHGQLADFVKFVSDRAE